MDEVVCVSVHAALGMQKRFERAAETTGCESRHRFSRVAERAESTARPMSQARPGAERILTENFCNFAREAERVHNV
jgi:hypothetical protein